MAREPYKYFQPEEFVCRCGQCPFSSPWVAFERMDPRLLEALDRARGCAGFPFIITSALRCPAHNRAVGGTARSAHLDGKAVDIRVPNSRARFCMITCLFGYGITRFGLGQNFIHVDTADEPWRVRDAIWLYQNQLKLNKGMMNT